MSLITFGMAKCSRCGTDVPYFGKHVFGSLKDNELLCFKCGMEEEKEYNNEVSVQRAYENRDFGHKDEEDNKKD